MNITAFGLSGRQFFILIIDILDRIHLFIGNHNLITLSEYAILLGGKV